MLRVIWYCGTYYYLQSTAAKTGYNFVENVNMRMCSTRCRTGWFFCSSLKVDQCLPSMADDRWILCRPRLGTFPSSSRDRVVVLLSHGCLRIVHGCLGINSHIRIGCLRLWRGAASLRLDEIICFSVDVYANSIWERFLEDRNAISLWTNINREQPALPVVPLILVNLIQQTLNNTS